MQRGLTRVSGRGFRYPVDGEVAGEMPAAASRMSLPRACVLAGRGPGETWVGGFRRS